MSLEDTIEAAPVAAGLAVPTLELGRARGLFHVVGHGAFLSR